MSLKSHLLFAVAMAGAVDAQAKRVETVADAIAVAEPALVAKFGKEEVAGQRPFRVRVVREEGKEVIWVVEGAIRKAPPGIVIFGGVVCVHIRESDGKIVELFMWK